MKLRRLIITVSAIVAMCLPASAQAWGDKLIKKLQADETVEKSIVVNRDSKTRKIDTESYTFRFKSANMYNDVRKELRRHLEDAEMFTQEDDKGRLVMRVKAGGNRLGLYEIRKEGKGIYCLKIYRSAGGILKAQQDAYDAGLAERERLLREDAEANARYQGAYEEGMAMRERLLREAKEEEARYKAAYDAGRSDHERLLREAKEDEARYKAAYDAGRSQHDRLLLEGKQQSRKDRINSEQGAKASGKAARVEAQRARTEAQKARIEAQKARVEAQREAQRARVEAQRESQRARVEAQRESQRARAEAQREAQRARTEAQHEAQRARVEAQRARAEAQREAQRARAEARREAQKSTTPRVRVIKTADKTSKAKEATAHDNDVRRKLADRKKQL